MNNKELNRFVDTVDHNHLQMLEASRTIRGYSLVETLIVVALSGVLSAIALLQLIAERRPSRSVGVTREILSQLRHTRQLAVRPAYQRNKPFHPKHPVLFSLKVF
ncbi:MAG: Tfp pilus assembly protein FimT/FimU [Pyrinomonadaceae bacterium]